MPALVLAGGLGTHLGPMVGDTPKPMAAAADPSRLLPLLPEAAG